MLYSGCLPPDRGNSRAGGPGWGLAIGGSGLVGTSARVESRHFRARCDWIESHRALISLILEHDLVRKVCNFSGSCSRCIIPPAIHDQRVEKSPMPKDGPVAPELIRGKCLCGGFRFEILGPIGEVRLCHCELCRRANGTAFSANARIPLKRYRVIAG